MTARASKFREDRPSKSTIRNLVKIGALRALPYGKKHLTRDAADAANHVADGLFRLRDEQSKAGLPPLNFSSAMAWDAWCARHPHTLAARAATASRLASRAAHRGQGDLFIAGAGVVA